MQCHTSENAEKNLNNILSFVIKHNNLHIVLLTTHATCNLMKVKLYEHFNARGNKKIITK